MFGRGSEEVADVEEIPSIEPRRPVGAWLVNNRRSGAGPFDVDDPDGFDIEGGLDFGSLRVPMPARAQLQVEHGSGELLRAVHVLVPAGRVSLSALAAPRSSPLWRDLADEIAQSLAKDGARVWAEWGSWGREVLAGSKGALSRFIGVDGPRWMLYGVATGPADDADELVETLREMIKKTVVTRGPDPLPVKTVLPLRLPEHLEERVEQAREQSARMSGGEAVGDAVVPVGPTGLAEEPDADPGPFPVEPYAEPFAPPRPVEPAPGMQPAAAAAFPAPLAPVRPVAAPPPPGYGAAAQQPGWGSTGERPVGAAAGRVPAGPARIDNPGQPTGPRGAPSHPAAAHTGVHPAGPASAPPRHPSSPPGSLHPSTPPGSLHPSIGMRPAGPAGYPDAGGWPSRTAPPPAGSPTGALRQSAAHPDGIRDSRGLDPRGDRRRGLPPVPTTAELDTNGFQRPGVEATWSLAKPVVSADQVAQQPAWALLSDAPTFWPHPTPPRGTRVPEPPDRAALDDAGGHRGRPGGPVPPYVAGAPAYPAGSAPSQPVAPQPGGPSYPAGQQLSTGPRRSGGPQHSGAQPYSDGQQGYPGGQRYSGGQPSGPHRRPSVPDPASQHRSAGYP
ncbi:MAG TPA: DUF3710 domain-containing protein, partial [Pseudonocardia sp.]|nr:DUF3710 domain-containing protein [Pseudonocardia sp.]